MRRRARRVLLVLAHPVPASLVAAAAERAKAAAERAGHEVRVIDLYRDGFDPVLSLPQWRSHEAGHAGRPDVVDHAASLRWAESLLFVYPTWFGAQPAILKGWFDRVWIEGVAFRLAAGGGVRPALRNIRRIVVVTTHGSSKTLNSLQGEPGKRVLLRGMRMLCHPLCRSSWIAFYGNDRASAADRAAFLDRVERRVGRL